MFKFKHKTESMDIHKTFYLGQNNELCKTTSNSEIILPYFQKNICVRWFLLLLLFFIRIYFSEQVYVFRIYAQKVKNIQIYSFLQVYPFSFLQVYPIFIYYFFNLRCLDLDNVNIRIYTTLIFFIQHYTTILHQSDMLMFLPVFSSC